MSAIAGILGRVADDANHAALRRMSAALKHRGPQRESTFQSSADADGNGCLLLHRSLATFDDAQQPFTQGTITLACDGPIFSHPRPADVVGSLHSLESVRGMFALAAWDDSARTLMLARDALGHRPLYFSRGTGSWSLVFASELRAQLASELLAKPRLDPTAVASVVWNGFVMSPATMVQGVLAVMPGQAISFPTGESKQFWRMPPTSATTTDESEMRRELHDTVKLYAQRSAPMGVLLSGGIDSSSVANLAQKQSDRAIDTYCMAMEESSLDESAAAREIAKAIGSNHHEVRLSEADFVQHLDAAIAALDQPTFDALNQFHICRTLRDAGLKIALGGIGGDAIFGGDKTFAQLPKAQRIANRTRIVPQSLRVAAAKLVASIASNKGSQQKWAKLPDVVKADGDLLWLYQLTYALFRPDFYEQLVTVAPLSYGLPQQTDRWLRAELDDHDAMSAAQILETRCFVGERLLRDADTVSSALSFELRSPLSDPRVIEQLARLPAEKKFLPVGYKPILRRHGLEGLDPKLFDRPKSGFVLPFDQWIRRNLGSVMEKTMLDPNLVPAAGLHSDTVAQLWKLFQNRTPGIYWTRVWAIYVLIRWCHANGVLV
jgi:asparagine synthase (glutamine-hydrolysing)